MNMTHLLAVLSCYWRWSDAVFPYTSARLQHWLYFLTAANQDTLDHQSVILTVLSLFLYLLSRVGELYRESFDPQDQLPPAFQFVCGAPFKWFLLYQAMDIFSALAMLITTPGFLAKFMVTLDLSFETLLIVTAKLSSCFLFILSQEAVAITVEYFSDDVYSTVFLNEDEVPANDSGEELDSEENNEEDYGEEEFDDWGILRHQLMGKDITESKVIMRSSNRMISWSREMVKTVEGI